MRSEDFSGVVYAGRRLADYLTIESVRWPARPPVANETERVSGRDGVALLATQYGELRVTIRARVFADARSPIEIARRFSEIGELLSFKEPQRLCLYPGAYIMAILDGDTDIDMVSCTGACELTFLCPDPIAWSAEEEALTIERADMLPADSGGNSLPIGGALPTRPTIRFEYSRPVEGDSSVFGLSSADSDRLAGWPERRIWFRSALPYVPADVFVIDSESRTVRSPTESSPRQIGILGIGSGFPVFGDGFLDGLVFRDAGVSSYGLERAVLTWQRRCFL